MQKLNDKVLQFDLHHIDEGLTLEIFPEQHSRIRQLDKVVAEQYNESVYQLFEGHSYEYKFLGINKANYCLRARINGVVIPSNRHAYRGRITPNIYVGNLRLEIVNTETEQSFPISVEVIATKFDKKEDVSYRENYRQMLEDITDKCTDLMMQINTPVTQHVTIDYSAEPKTLYQRFCFVKSFLDSVDFEEAIIRIISNPSTVWKTEETSIKTSQIRRLNRTIAKQFVTASNRIDTSRLAYLNDMGLSSVPRTIQSDIRIESVDTPENRVIKHVLGVFLHFVKDCQAIFSTAKKYQFALKESSLFPCAPAK